MARSIEVKIVVDTRPLRRALRSAHLQLLRQSVRNLQAETRVLLEDLNRGPGARELAVAQTKLEEAEMWIDRSDAAAACRAS